MVMSVPDDPEITLPSSPTLEEDGEVSLQGLGMYDADLSRPDGEVLSFTVWLEVVVGWLSLNHSTVSFPGCCKHYIRNGKQIWSPHGPQERPHMHDGLCRFCYNVYGKDNLLSFTPCCDSRPITCETLR